MEKAEKVGVIAVTKIPRGARSAYLNLDRSSLLSSQDVPPGFENLQVGMWSNSEIQPLNTSLLPSSSFWPRLIKLAPDCHAQNVQLSRVSGGQVVLSASKDIPSGSELFLWFDEDILMDEMHIPPYLSPVNIRVGGNSYICNICGCSFQAPNNLKIHIALNCGSLPMRVLWGRLVSSSTSSPNHAQTLSTNTLSASPHSYIWSSSLLPTTPQPPLLPILMNGNMRNFANVSAPLSLPNGQSIHNPAIVTSSSSSTGHAQQPLSVMIAPGASRIPNSNGHHHNRHSKTEFQRQKSNLVKTTPESSTPRRRQNNGTKRCANPAVEKAISVSVSDPEAQLESIVSNMGKARNGHMCLYCGKLYSRKYGLKIHIRTHTGYKPLRCRICHRPFGDPSNLNKHIRLHSDGNTPYRCDICDKVLVRKRDLERHVRSRHGNSHPNNNVILPLSLPANGITALDCRTPSGSSGS